jgi:hypothetical protein
MFAGSSVPVSPSSLSPPEELRSQSEASESIRILRSLVDEPGVVVRDDCLFVPDDVIANFEVSSGDLETVGLPSLSAIPRMTAGSIENLRRFRVSCKPEAFRLTVCEGGTIHHPADLRKLPILPSSRHTSPVDSVCTQHNRTFHAGDGSGFGRNSAIIRKMSANKVLGIVTSAIWNAT